MKNRDIQPSEMTGVLEFCTRNFWEIVIYCDGSISLGAVMPKAGSISFVLLRAEWGKLENWYAKQVGDGYWENAEDSHNEVLIEREDGNWQFWTSKYTITSRNRKSRRECLCLRFDSHNRKNQACVAFIPRKDFDAMVKWFNSEMKA